MNLYIKVMNTYTYIAIINVCKRRVRRKYISFVFLQIGRNSVKKKTVISIFFQ